MNTQQLKCFLAVAEKLNYAKAAQELYLTQPTVTQQINSLEKELGVRLFYRTKHTVSLTQEGRSYRSLKVVFLPLVMLAIPPVPEAFTFSCPLCFKTHCLIVVSAEML